MGGQLIHYTTVFNYTRKISAHTHSQTIDSYEFSLKNLAPGRKNTRVAFTDPQKFSMNSPAPRCVKVRRGV